MAWLGALCVLLPLNLLNGSTEAHAANVAAGPTLIPVSISTTQIIGTNGSGAASWPVFRMWSDGSVNTTLVKFVCNSPQPLCNIQTSCTVEVPVD